MQANGLSAGGESAGKHNVAGQGFIQAIDFNENFNDKLERYLSDRSLASWGRKYHVVSILGPQSSGKSTLLNMLFDTTFDTMDAQQGRYQVTKGVWLAVDDASRTVVVDLEGTDSRERRDEAASFERKTALLALAVSEALIVNIWTQDVGRLGASNLLLLRNLLELYAQLFISARRAAGEEMPRTELLFVLRDHVSSPLNTLAHALRADIEQMWDTLEKPSELQQSKVEDFFTLRFVSLPHKNLAAEEFARAGRDLRESFLAGEHYDGEAYNRDVDSAEFALYVRNVWETIAANRELDVPSQREMVSVMRCDDVVTEQIAAVSAELFELRAHLVSRGVKATPPAQDLQKSRRSALQRFHEATSRYVPKVVARKQAELARQIDTKITQLMAEFCDVVAQNVHATLLSTMDSEPKDGGRASDKHERAVDGANAHPLWRGFANRAMKAELSALSTFDTLCAPPADVVPAEELVRTRRADVVKELTAELQTRKNAAKRAAEFELRSEAEQALRSQVTPLIDDDRPLIAELWPRVERACADVRTATLERARHLFGVEGLGLDPDDGELTHAISMTQEMLSRVTLDEIKRSVGGSSGVLRRMKQRFVHTFRFDEVNQQPRVWAPRDDVAALYANALSESYVVADTLRVVRVGDGIVPAQSAQILDELACSEVKQQLDRDAALAFVEARHAQEMARIKSRVPIWAIALVAFLGYGEARKLVQRPVWLVLVLVLGAVLYALNQSGALQPVSEAAMKTLSPVFRWLRLTLGDMLSDVNTEPLSAQQGTAESSEAAKGLVKGADGEDEDASAEKSKLE